MKTCCIAGHQDIPHDKIDFIKTRLREEIEQAVEDGYTHFINTFTGRASLYGAEIVADIISRNPAISMEAALIDVEHSNRLLEDKQALPLLMVCNIIGKHVDQETTGGTLRCNRFIANQANRIIVVYQDKEHDEVNNDGTVQLMRFAHILELEERIINL